MKKLVGWFPLLVLLLLSITSVHASVKIQATINRDIHVVFVLRNVNSTIRNKIISSGSLNASTIPEIIQENFEQQNLTNAEAIFDSTQEIFDNSTIHIEFYLEGSNIVDFTINKTSLNRVYRVATEWRKFQIDLTEDISLNFTEYFGKPLSSPPWQLMNYTDLENETYPAYYGKYTASASFDPEFYFILPKEASQIHIEGKDTIAFELPPSQGEDVLNSPILVLGGIIVALIFASLYRAVTKSGGQEVDVS